MKLIENREALLMASRIMRRLLNSLLVTVWVCAVLISPAIAQGSGLSGAATNAHVCNGACQARRTEPQLLKPGIAERVGDRLVLTFGGRRLIFTDNQKACADGHAGACAIYALVANAPGSLAVRKFEFEGSDTVLIDTRSGRQTELAGVPTFSPDGREFVIASFSNESNDNLEVWRRQDDGAKLEWAHPFKQSWAEDPALLRNRANPFGQPPVYRVTGWHDDHVSLAVSTEDQRYHWTGSLIRSAKGWRLSANSPPGLLR